MKRIVSCFVACSMPTDTPQPEMPGRKRRIGGGPMVGLILLLLPVLYVLGFGPAAWLSDHGYIPNSVARAFYFPLILLAEHVEPIKRVLVWYERLCVPR